MVIKSKINLCGIICTVICTFINYPAFCRHYNVATPSIIISADKTTICAGTTVKFTATPTDIGPGATYQWVVNGTDAGANSTGTTFTTSALQDQDKVTCNVTNTGGTPSAVSSNAILISYYGNESPSVVVSETIVNKCAATFEASPINGGTAPVYKWAVNGVDMNVNSHTFVDNNPVNNDLIECTIINTTTCSPTNTATKSIRLTAASSMSLSITSDPPGGNICEKGTVNFSITAQPEVPGTEYWLFLNGVNTGYGTFHTGLTWGIGSLKDGDVIDVRILNIDPCLATSPVISNQIKVIVSQPPTVTIAADKNNVCAGTPIIFTATVLPKQVAGYTWKINGVVVPNEHLDKFTTTQLKDADQVTCIIVGDNACKTPVPSNTVLMYINPLPVITMPKAIEITLGKSAQLKPAFNTSIASYKWTPSTGLSNPNIADPVASPLEPATYQLTVISANGCTATASVTVQVSIVITPPNTFTPNGDGINDTWAIPDLAPYTSGTVDVFDRYGQVVFHSLGYTKPWDGSRNGKRLPAGTYYYLIDTKRSSTKFSGPVTILR